MKKVKQEWKDFVKQCEERKALPSDLASKYQEIGESYMGFKLYEPIAIPKPTSYTDEVFDTLLEAEKEKYIAQRDFYLQAKEKQREERVPLDVYYLMLAITHKSYERSKQGLYGLLNEPYINLIDNPDGTVTVETAEEKCVKAFNYRAKNVVSSLFTLTKKDKPFEQIEPLIDLLKKAKKFW